MKQTTTQEAKMETRQKRYEAKDDAKQYFAQGGQKDVSLYEVSVPGASRQYIAIVHDNTHDSIMSQFSEYVESDYFCSWDF